MDRAIGKATEANFGTLQILQDSHGLVEFKGDLADQTNAALVIFVGAMGKIEAEGGGTRFD